MAPEVHQYEHHALNGNHRNVTLLGQDLVMAGGDCRSPNLSARPSRIPPVLDHPSREAFPAGRSMWRQIVNHQAEGPARSVLIYGGKGRIPAARLLMSRRIGHPAPPRGAPPPRAEPWPAASGVPASSPEDIDPHDFSRDGGVVMHRSEPRFNKNEPSVLEPPANSLDGA